MQTDYHELLIDQGIGSNSGTNSFIVGENCDDPILEAQTEFDVELNQTKSYFFPRVYKSRGQTLRHALKSYSHREASLATIDSKQAPMA